VLILFVGCWVEGVGNAEASVELVWRPLEVLANGLSFRIRVAAGGYLPGRVILDVAAFVGGRFEGFHMDMDTIRLQDSSRNLRPEARYVRTESDSRTLCRYREQLLSTTRSEVTQTPDDAGSDNSRSDRGRDVCDNRHDRVEVEKHEDSCKEVDQEGDDKINQSVVEDKCHEP